MNHRTATWLLAAGMAITIPFTALTSAFPSDPPTVAEKKPTTAAGTKRALIICGLSGDADHHALFAETVVNLHDGLSRQLGFEADNVRVLFGDEPNDNDTDLIKSAGRANREGLQQAAKGLRETLTAGDSLWVIVLGHSHFDGTHSWLHLAGPDLQELEFARLFADVPAREQVFLMTTPTSGVHLKTLSAKGRVVATATEDGQETNETEFPHVLARVLSDPPAAADFDVDQDGATTVLDLYLLVARNVAQSYVTSKLLATEHSFLEDNGDGRGTEVQIDYLTVEQGGRAKPGVAIVSSLKPTDDGSLAKSIVLTLPPMLPEKTCP